MGFEFYCNSKHTGVLVLKNMKNELTYFLMQKHCIRYHRKSSERAETRPGAGWNFSGPYGPENLTRQPGPLRAVDSQKSGPAGQDDII